MAVAAIIAITATITIIAITAIIATITITITIIIIITIIITIDITMAALETLGAIHAGIGKTGRTNKIAQAARPKRKGNVNWADTQARTDRTTDRADKPHSTDAIKKGDMMSNKVNKTTGGRRQTCQ